MDNALNPIVTKRHSGNIIDIFRFIASFAVVWFHNSYSSVLLVDSPLLYGKYLSVLAFFVSWALPFFYITSAKFSMASASRTDSSLKLKLLRLARLVRFIFFYIAVYEISTALFAYVRSWIYNYIYSWPFFEIFMYGNTSKDVADRVFNILLTVNNSPLYYLNHVLIISIAIIIFSSICKIGPTTRKIAIITLFVATAFVLITRYDFASFRGIVFGWSGWISVVLLGFCYYFVTLKLKLPKRKNASSLEILLVVVFIILISGASYQLSTYLLTNGSAAIGFLYYYVPVWTLLFLIAGDIYSASERPLIIKLSEYGRKYSLGIIAWHFVTQKWIGGVLSMLTEKMENPPYIFFMILTNIAAFLLAWLISMFCYKKCRWTVTI